MSLSKTKAIVLHHIKYGDTSIILDAYTQQFGRMSFIVNGVYGRKSPFRINSFQSLFLLDLEIYFKNSRELQRIKEQKNDYPFSTISNNLVKSTVSLFLAEVLYRALRESEPNPMLFDFVSKAIVWYDQQSEGYLNFHLLFLLNLTRYLGFYPNSDDFEDSTSFDLREGLFLYHFPSHRQVIQGSMLPEFKQMINRSVTDSAKLNFNRDTRNVLISVLIDYYQIHLQGMGQIQSLAILQEVFST
jgi:DNA repair protein RecO (recombination protein O)